MSNRCVISYVLWGNLRLYNENAINNLRCRDKYFKEFDIIFYVSEDVPVLKTLQQYAKCVLMPPASPLLRSTENIDWHRNPVSRLMSQRYRALDEDYDYILFRDVDSLLSPRDRDAVNYWMTSGYMGLCLYECEQHWNGMVMPGMSSLVGGVYKNIVPLMENFSKLYDSCGEPDIFYDIHCYRELFIKPIDYSVLRMGYNTNLPLTTPMPPELGRFIGDVVQVSNDRNEEWSEAK